MSRFPAAVVLDVDGTLVDSERDGHRVAFNLAFEELGLPYRWDVEEYGELLRITGGQRRLDAYLADEGVPDEERADLVPRLHQRKTDRFLELVLDGRLAPRPGCQQLVDELEEAGVRLAVATTGSRAWVEPLLDRLFGPGRFEVMVTGDEAPDRKPDPLAHRMTLEALGVAHDAALAIEDSHHGLVAAKAAGLACVVVVNEYTRGQDMGEADLVLDGFGTPEEPAEVIRDPHRVAVDGRLDLAALEKLAP